MVRGLVFEYLGLTALGAYLTLVRGARGEPGREGRRRYGRVACIGAGVIGFGSGANGVAAGSMLLMLNETLSPLTMCLATTTSIGKCVRGSIEQARRRRDLVTRGDVHARRAVPGVEGLDRR